MVGLFIVNVVIDHKDPSHAFDGFRASDAIIATAAGALTGGTSAFVGGATFAGGRVAQVAVGSGVAFTAAGLSQATRPKDPANPPDPNELLLSAVFGGAGALFPDPRTAESVIGALVGGGVFNAVSARILEGDANPTIPSDLYFVPAGKGH